MFPSSLKEASSLQCKIFHVYLIINPFKNIPSFLIACIVFEESAFFIIHTHANLISICHRTDPPSFKKEIVKPSLNQPLMTLH